MKQIYCGITGHTGTIGKNLIKNNKGIIFSYFKGDITKKKQVRKWINKSKFEYVIHLAAIVPIKEVNNNKKKAYNVNTVGTSNLVDALINTKNNVSWLFFSSTSHVYSSSKSKIKENFPIKPISYYGKTKYLAEKKLKKLKNKKIKLCIGRIFSTANNSQRKNYLVPDLKNKIKKSIKKINLNNLNHFRDFISINDISKIILFFLKNKTEGIINISSGKKVKLSSIAEVIAKKYKKKINIETNSETTYLVGDNQKLKKVYKKKLNINLKDMIFNN